MNPVDHPMGGGEGRASVVILDLRMEFLQGYRTRNRKKFSNKFIIEEENKICQDQKKRAVCTQELTEESSRKLGFK